MKKFALVILAATLFCACLKSIVTPARPDVTGFPTASTRYEAADHTINFRSYLYDSSHNLAGVSFRENDTIDVSNGIFTVDSGSYRFDVNPANNLPTGYRLDYKKGYTGAQTVIETHLLYYNSQQQLVKDSGLLALAGQNPAPPSKYYTYSGNKIIRTSFQGGSAYLTDTLIVGGGNLQYASSYYNSGSGWTKQYSENFTYSGTASPFYNQGLSNSLGAFLLVEGVGDFLSANLPNNDGFTWVLGGNGKAASGSAPNGDYETFSY